MTPNCRRCDRMDQHYHLDAEVRCPKCGAMTQQDQTERWRACMFFSDAHSSVGQTKEGGPIPGCDYGEWLPGGKEAADAEWAELNADFGDAKDREIAMGLLKAGASHDQVADTFSIWYERPVTKGTIVLWELEWVFD